MFGIWDQLYNTGGVGTGKLGRRHLYYFGGLIFLAHPVGVDFYSELNAEFGYILEVGASSLLCMMIYLLFCIDSAISINYFLKII